MTDPIRHLPETLREPVRRGLAGRERTIYDARRLLSPHRDELIRLVVDDGMQPDPPVTGLYRTVVHSPAMGIGLVLDGALPVDAPDLRSQPAFAQKRKRRTTFPVDLIRELPDGFRFLRAPRDEWPMPPAFVPCDRCGEQANAGRFCVQCGILVRRGRRDGRRGRRSDFLGEGFAVVQTILRDGPRVPDGERTEHICGAMIYRPRDRYCPKCGEEIARSAETDG